MIQLSAGSIGIAGRIIYTNYLKYDIHTIKKVYISAYCYAPDFIRNNKQQIRDINGCDRGSVLVLSRMIGCSTHSM